MKPGARGFESLPRNHCLAADAVQRLLSAGVEFDSRRGIQRRTTSVRGVAATRDHATVETRVQFPPRAPPPTTEYGRYRADRQRVIYGLAGSNPADADLGRALKHPSWVCPLRGFPAVNISPDIETRWPRGEASGCNPEDEGSTPSRVSKT